MLRKDFIIDPYQVIEARAAGADAVLLIAECLDDRQLRALHEAIVALDMTPLVELYEPANLPRVLAAGARLIGINNRDLRTFEVDLEHTIRVPSLHQRNREPPGGRSIVRAIVSLAHSLHLKVVAEGVETPEQLDFLKATGCDEYQGFHFSRPLPAADFERLMRQSIDAAPFSDEDAARTHKLVPTFASRRSGSMPAFRGREPPVHPGRDQG